MAVRVLRSTATDRLAASLAEALADGRSAGTLFASPLILVPNAHMLKWLQREIVARGGAGLAEEIRFVDSGVWQLLARLDPRNAARGEEPQRLTRECLQWMILAALWAHAPEAEALAPFRTYMGLPDFAAGAVMSDPVAVRKLWHYAESLSRLLPRYESHLRGWPERPLGASLPEERRAEERLQAFLYGPIFDAGGLRDRVAEATGRRWLTIPQYAAELDLERDLPRRLESAGLPSLHLFAPAELTPWQAEFLRALAAAVPVRVYLPVTEADGEKPRAGSDLWGRTVAGWRRVERETLRRLAGAEVEDLAPLPAPARADRLHRLRAAILEAPAARESPFPDPPEGDRSLRVVRCASVRREVELVRDHLLARLEEAETRLDDIGILVTDITLYKPHIEAVLGEAGLPVAIVDATAERDSFYAAAMEGILALGESRFGRPEILRLAENPCFQAGAGLAETEAAQWADWVARLHVYRGFDAADKTEALAAVFADRGEEEGPQPSERFTWSRGLRRLRYGRILVTESDLEAEEEPPAVAGTLPYGDLGSQSAEAVSRICRAVEHLAALRERMRGARSLADWGAVIEEIDRVFLGIPASHRLEEAVRESLLEAAGGEAGATLDCVLRAAGLGGAPVPPLLARLHVRQSMMELATRRGQFGLGGATFAALRPGRTVPFSHLYLLGLGEGIFPDREEAGALDLLEAGLPPERRLSAADLERQTYLAALLAAGESLTLSWVGFDLREDKVFHPCSCLYATLKLLEARGGMTERDILQQPLLASESIALRESPDRDLLLTRDPRSRLVGLAGILERDPERNARLETFLAERREEARPGAEKAGGIVAARERSVLTHRQLYRYCLNPIDAVLRIGLGVREREEEAEELAEDEPLETPLLPAGALLQRTILRLIDRWGRAGAPVDAAAEAEAEFDAAYARAELADEVPEGSYAVADRERLRTTLADVARETAAWVRRRADARYFPALAFGQAAAPPDAYRFPALRFDVPLRTDAAGESVRTVEMHGASGPAWLDEAGRWWFLLPHLWSKGDAKPHKKAMEGYLLAAMLRHAFTEAADLPEALAEAGEICLVHIGTAARAQSYACGAFDPEWLPALVADLVNDTGEEALPFEPAVETLVKCKPEEDFAERLDAAIRRRIDSPKIAWHDWPAYLDTVRWFVPADARERAARRFGPLLAAAGKESGR